MIHLQELDVSQHHTSRATWLFEERPFLLQTELGRCVCVCCVGFNSIQIVQSESGHNEKSKVLTQVVDVVQRPSLLLLVFD